MSDTTITKYAIVALADSALYAAMLASQTAAAASATAAAASAANAVGRIVMGMMQTRMEWGRRSLETPARQRAASLGASRAVATLSTFALGKGGLAALP